MNQLPKIKCVHCGKELGDCNIETFGRYLKGYKSNARRGLFCNKECYERYKKQFEIEIYNDRPIYAVDYFGEKRFMPYWFSIYYFKTIEECKTRMDMKVASIPTQLLGVLARGGF